MRSLGTNFIGTIPFILLEDILFCAGPHDGGRGPPTPGVHDFPRVFPERNIRNNFGGQTLVASLLGPESNASSKLPIVSSKL